jgi:hypothetical protein
MGGPGFGGPPPAPPGANIPSADLAHDVDLPANGPGLPPACACCLGAPQGVLTVSHAQTQGRVTTTRRLNVPYCDRCKAHVKALSRRNLIIGLIAIAVSAPLPFLLVLLWDYAPAALVFALPIAVALGLVALLGTVWKAPPVATAQGCVANHRAVKIVNFSPFSTRVRLFNPQFAMQTAQGNGAQPFPSKARRPTPAQWIVAPLFGLIAAIPGYILTHGAVYFDNPSTVPLTFVVDDGAESVTVQPGSYQKVTLPYGPRQVVVQMNGQAVDRINGDVAGTGDYVASPMGTACYARLTTAYGSASVSANDQGHLLTGQRWYDVDGVDFVLAPFPSSISVSQGQSGARRSRFARIDCGTGEAVP